MVAAGRLRPRDGVVHREMDGGGVLLDLRSGDYFGLNGTGTLLWRLLPGTLAEIVDEVRAQRPDAPPGVAEDVRAFFDSLADRGLITRDATGQAGVVADQGS